MSRCFHDHPQWALSETSRNILGLWANKKHTEPWDGPGPGDGSQRTRILGMGQ